MIEVVNVSADPGAEQVPDLIDPTNYALDPAVVERVKSEILPVIPQVRSQRKTVEERWIKYFKVWQGKHDKRLYEGRSDLYPRIAYKIVQTFIAHTKGQLFPTVDTFDIEPSPFDPISIILAPLIKRLLRHDIEQSQMERKLNAFLRDGFIYGCSVVKSAWKLQQSKNYRRMIEPMPGLEDMQQHSFAPQMVTLYEGPTFDVVDLLNWFIHPITCTDIDDAQMIFEDVVVTYSHLLSMEQAGIYAGVARVKEDKADHNAATTEGNRDQRVERYGYSTKDIDQKNRHTIQEVWAKFDLYGDGMEVPCKVVLCKDHVLEVRQNPFFNQRAPYRAWRMIDLPDNFYGMGVVETVEHYQYALNAMMNASIDSAMFQVSPIIQYDKSRVPVDERVIRITPRALWPALGNPKEVYNLDRPPDTSSAGFATVQLIAGLMQDVAGAPPQMQGKMSNTDKTATEINATTVGANAALSGMVRDVEVQVLSPLLRDWYIQEQQFRAVDSHVKITGTIPMEIAPTELVGDYNFRWRVGTMVGPLGQMRDEADKAGMSGGPQPVGPGGGPPTPGGGMGPSTVAGPGLGTEPALGI